MDTKQFQRILDEIKKIEISQAVITEKLNSMDARLDRTNKRLDHANKDFDEIKKRVDRLDRIAGAIVIAIAMLGTLIKFKII